MSLRKKVEEKSAITTARVAEKQFAWMISAKSQLYGVRNWRRGENNELNHKTDVHDKHVE